MLGTKVFYTFIGVMLAVSLTPVLALTTTETKTISTEQEYALKYTGMYQPVYDQPVKIYTYETLCKGYYTLEDNGLEIKYTGFGDLADDYTYTITKPVVDTLKASSTPPLNEKILDTESVALPVDASTTDISY